MKRIILFLSAMLSFCSLVLATSTDVSQANQLYIKGNYSDAAKLYEKVLSTEGVAPELYLNLGNAYYKSNEIGRSILNYERALRLSPMYDDARVNLELAQLKVVDNNIQNNTFFVGRWIDNLIKMLDSNQWFFISFSVFLICIICSFIFVFGPTRLLRKYAFYIGFILFGFSLLSFVFSGIRKNQIINHSEAIVMTGTISVKSSPDKSGTDLFQLHEGTKVTIKSTLGSWTEIKLGNGNIGWVEQENIEKI
jgi:tetratricopeptide (TPR) repeat protein